ncbi:MAG TPA: histidine--tRNA ligase, partial [Firmicutes bacterium]|nr:histidine--tRNA ligase [Bacillota bacterium]
MSTVVEDGSQKQAARAYQAPRGTRDILPYEIGSWHALERACRSVLECAGYKEIRTPMFEHTELFERGIGETTDIVEKEMYTFTDRAGRSLTLRPEGTASVVRAYLQHKMYAGPQPVKLYYIGPMFRYERPQAGRYREFWQFGAEALGAPDPAIDAELIEILIEVLRGVGLDGFTVRLNSLGCPACRPRYRNAVYEWLESRQDMLCPDCQRRLDRNPLRVLDCKTSGCREATHNIPSIFEHLCEECTAHFEELKKFLDTGGIDYSIDERIVRGLDYYTRTVFEVVHRGLGAQDALGGGGRYDG